MDTPVVTLIDWKCFLCGETNPAEGFSDEHVFPASIGGTLVAPQATCLRPCNADCSTGFEAEFLNSVKVLSGLLGIGNREGNVPNLDVMLTIDGRPFEGVLKADGELLIVNQFEKQTTAAGKVVKRWWLFDDSSFDRLQRAAAKRGERLVLDEPQCRDIELLPESFMPLGFLNSPTAKRMAAKVALTCVAAKLGQAVACSAAFNDVREFIREGTGNFARLFFNNKLAAHMLTAPFQHLVVVSFNAQNHTAHAIVIFFGTMPYIVELSRTYQGVDFGWHYAFDAKERKEVDVFVGHLEQERLMVEDVLSPDTRFDDIVAVAEHGADIIQRVAGRRVIEAVKTHK